MKHLLFVILTLSLIAGCTTRNDVAIQTAHANARAQECAAVAGIAQAGAASEAAVLMAARGCGGGATPKTSADKAVQLVGALAPVAGAVISGAVAIKQGETNARTQRDQIAASTAIAGIEAGVLTTLGRDQVVTVDPHVVTAPDPVIVNAPDPIVVQTPDPVIVDAPDPIIIDAPEPIIIETPQTDVIQ